MAMSALTVSRAIAKTDSWMAENRAGITVPKNTVYTWRVMTWKLSVLLRGDSVDHMRHLPPIAGQEWAGQKMEPKCIKYLRSLLLPDPPYTTAAFSRGRPPGWKVTASSRTCRTFHLSSCILSLLPVPASPRQPNIKMASWMRAYPGLDVSRAAGPICLCSLQVCGLCILQLYSNV